MRSFLSKKERFRAYPEKVVSAVKALRLTGNVAARLTQEYGAKSCLIIYIYINIRQMIGLIPGRSLVRMQIKAPQSIITSNTVSNGLRNPWSPHQNKKLKWF